MFIDSWGQAENAVAGLLHQVLNLDFARVYTIFLSMGMRQVIDLIRSVATSQLTDECILQLNNLLDRLGSINAKRNTLVHGSWVLELVLWGHRGILRQRAIYARESVPNDFRIRERLHDLRNQKERAKYIFSVKRIRSASLEAIAIADDISGFAKTGLKFREMREWQVSEFLSPLHPTPQTKPYHLSHLPANRARSSEP